MQTQLNGMETQINDLRGDYLMYQHYMNMSTNFFADAASSFGIAGVYYDAGSSYYSNYLEWWDYGGWLYDASYDYYEDALDYAEDLGIPVEVGSPLSFRLLRHDLSKVEIAPKKK